jgi:translation initiation factor IF-2
MRLEDLFKAETKEVTIIVKADVKGSVIAVKESLEKLSTDEVKVRVIHAQAGALSENDVMLASASNAIIIGFNIRPSTSVEKAAEKEGVEIRTYNVIYHIHDDIRKAMTGLLAPVLREEIVGRAEVRETFRVPKVGLIAGCIVHDGKIVRNKTARILREGVIIYNGRVESLRRFKEDVTEVRNGYECGIGIEKYNDVKVGDTIEVFEIIEEAGVL